MGKFSNHASSDSLLSIQNFAREIYQIAGDIDSNQYALEPPEIVPPKGDDWDTVWRTVLLDSLDKKIDSERTLEDLLLGYKRPSGHKPTAQMIDFYLWWSQSDDLRGTARELWAYAEQQFLSVVIHGDATGMAKIQPFGRPSHRRFAVVPGSKRSPMAINYAVIIRMLNKIDAWAGINLEEHWVQSQFRDTESFTRVVSDLEEHDIVVADPISHDETTDRLIKLARYALLTG